MAQHGAYTLLLWEYYINGPLPANDMHLHNVCMALADENRQDVSFVLSRFFTLRRGKWYHQRADEELARRQHIRNERVKAAEKRHQKPSKQHANGNANGVHLDTQSQSHKTITPLTPLSGGPIQKLTPREEKKVLAEMHRLGQLRIGVDIDDAQVFDMLAKACAKVGVGLERAKYLLGSETI
jgi:uncharacterized protein YdaU (DUF1376 family)